MCEYNKVDFSLLSNQLTIIVCMRLFRSVWSPSDAIHYGYGYLCSKDIKSPTAKLFSFFESFNDEAMWRMRLSTPYPIVVVFNNTIICNLNDNMFDTIDSEKRSQFPSTFFFFSSASFSLSVHCFVDLFFRISLPNLDLAWYTLVSSLRCKELQNLFNVHVLCCWWDVYIWFAGLFCFVLSFILFFFAAFVVWPEMDSSRTIKIILIGKINDIRKINI